MRRSGQHLTWSAEQLAHACDVVVQGLRDRTPFNGNPTFIDAMETAAKLLRGDSSKIRDVRCSARQDGMYLMIKVKELPE